MKTETIRVDSLSIFSLTVQRNRMQGMELNAEYILSREANPLLRGMLGGSVVSGRSLDLLNQLIQSLESDALEILLEQPQPQGGYAEDKSTYFPSDDLTQL